MLVIVPVNELVASCVVRRVDVDALHAFAVFGEEQREGLEVFTFDE
jgi:hypothetical protein